jgi:hypothetical protein
MILEKFDKIRWNLPEDLGGGTIYTILDIDRTRKLKDIKNEDGDVLLQVKEEILFKWYNPHTGEEQIEWGHDYDLLNEEIKNNRIIIVEKRKMIPTADVIKKLKL